MVLTKPFQAKIWPRFRSNPIQSLYHCQIEKDKNYICIRHKGGEKGWGEKGGLDREIGWERKKGK